MFLNSIVNYNALVIGTRASTHDPWQLQVQIDDIYDYTDPIVLANVIDAAEKSGITSKEFLKTLGLWAGKVSSEFTWLNAYPVCIQLSMTKDVPKPNRKSAPYQTKITQR